MEFFNFLMSKAENDGIKKKIAGGLILNSKNEVLMLKRKADDFMGGIFELPSGNLEEGENINQGLIREIKEETNLDVEEIKMFVNSFDYLSSSGKKSRQFNFEVKVKQGNIELTEHDEYKWIKLEDVFKDELVTDEVKHSVAILKYNKQI